MKKPMQSWFDKRAGGAGGGEGDTLRTAIFRLNIAREDSKTALRVS